MATERQAADQKGFRRLNFFKGLVTTEKDWIDEEAYRAEKRRLHNRGLHRAGIVRGSGGDLLTSARGDLSIEILDGAAVDGRGREVVLWEPVIKTISVEAYKPMQWVYVTLRFEEVPTDFIAYRSNLAVRGHRRMMETSVLEIGQTEPDLDDAVEIARFMLEPNTKTLRDARDPANPRPNELTQAFAPRAGVAGSHCDGGSRVLIATTMRNLSRSLALLLREGQIQMAMVGVSMLSQTAIMYGGEVFDRRHFFELSEQLLPVLEDALKEIMTFNARIREKKEIGDVRQELVVLKAHLADRHFGPKEVERLCGTLQKIADAIKAIWPYARTTENVKI